MIIMMIIILLLLLIIVIIIIVIIIIINIIIIIIIIIIMWAGAVTRGGARGGQKGPGEPLDLHSLQTNAHPMWLLRYPVATKHYEQIPTEGCYSIQLLLTWVSSITTNKSPPKVATVSSCC